MLRIRLAKVADADSIIAGINEICIEGGAFYIREFQLSEQWQVALCQPNAVTDHLILIAEWQGQFAGSIRLFPGQSHTLHRHVADLGLFVLKPYRRLGIGTLLMVKAIEWARSSKLEKTTLIVFGTNLPAIRLYQRFGFQQEGCLRRQIKIDNQYIDLLQMSLFL